MLGYYGESTKSLAHMGIDAMAPTTDADETRHNIQESADKIRLKTKLKRGTGTRDQDTIEVQVKGDDPEACVKRLNQTVNLLATTADTVRKVQPGAEDHE